MVAPEKLATRYWYDLAQERYGEFGRVVPLDRRGRVHKIRFLDSHTGDVNSAVVKYISNTLAGRGEVKAGCSFPRSISKFTTIKRRIKLNLYAFSLNTIKIRIK